MEGFLYICREKLAGICRDKSSDRFDFPLEAIVTLVLQPKLVAGKQRLNQFS